MKLVPEHGAQAHQFVAMPEQLPKIAFSGCGNPDPRKTVADQKFENERSIALIGLLLANLMGTNFRGVPDPQFVAEFREQTLEPMNGPGRFDAHTHRPLQAAVERLSLATLVVQPPLGKFSRDCIQHSDLLIACMKIAAYNQHCSAPFFRASVVSATKFTRS